MTGDKAIKWTAIASVAVVALVAASVSYRHALAVVGQHGETGWLDKVYPLTVDGLIYAASMVLLNDARCGLKPHWVAYGALGLGISATLAVNVAAGLAYGVLGAMVAAWPNPSPGDLLRAADADLPQVGRAAGLSQAGTRCS
jgi:hypothetical protein